MLEYIRDNANWIFSGIGITALTAIAYFIRLWFKRNSAQEQKISGGSTGIQAGRDININND